MPPSFSKILTKYADVLDDWQRDVDNIRKMHHEIWKESRVYPIIKQHRAGSRVEKQCRILPMGKQTDVDYKFEVTGIMVDTRTNASIYWKPSSFSNVHGKIHVTKSKKEELSSKNHYSDIFTEESFEWDNKERAYLLVPRHFKENVVVMSKFEYKRDANITADSPSVPGQGAVNEYDIVPCLRFQNWPGMARGWIKRDQHNLGVLSSDWRKSIVQNESLFVVPAGDPCSKEKEQEFRLSFSLIEVKCFEKLPSNLRKIYGFIRYIYKTAIEPLDLLDSYHMKSLFFAMLDEKDADYWRSCRVWDVLVHFFDLVGNACLIKYVPHIFVDDCNIFPFHKSFISQKTERLRVLLSDKSCLKRELVALLVRDLRLTKDDEFWLLEAENKLIELEDGRAKLPYVNGYVTRLLSLITYSLYENNEQNTLEQAINRIHRLFESNSDDENIWRMIPMVNATLIRMDISGKRYAFPLQTGISAKLYNQTFVDDLSNKMHWAFEAYLRQEFSRVEEILRGNIHQRYIPTSIGISVTNFHKRYLLDEPLHFVIRSLEKKSKENKCPRFYLDPILLAHHLEIQINIKIRNIQPSKLEIDILNSLAHKQSERDPYLGRLSYKFAAMLLLQGYTELMGETSVNLQAVDITDPESFNQRQYATNFDLR